VITTDALDFLGDAANYAISQPGSSNPRLNPVMGVAPAQHSASFARSAVCTRYFFYISIHRMNQHFLRDCCHGEDSA